MPYTMEGFRRDFTKEHLDLLSPEELIEGRTPEQVRTLQQRRLKGLTLPEMEAVVEELKQEVEELKQEIERSKASRQAGRRPARPRQERTQPERSPPRRKRKTT